MRFKRSLALIVAATALSALPARTPAQPIQTHPSQTQPAQAQAIRGVLERSVADWNRGDLDAFATSYKNSPDILFIGRTTHRGYAAMLATYKAGYGTAAKRGTLSFSQLEVQPLDTRFATVTGHFHLQRTAAGGGNANGYFLLVFENTANGWKIVRDDTTDLPATASK